MSAERIGEIALALVKYQLVQKGVPGHFGRELGNVAKQIGGVDREELQDFMALIMPEVIEKLLGRSICD
tara:strand:- start:189 stop:395 length:207 start_codon:yes stop_codon:yes gene_type:complete